MAIFPPEMGQNQQLTLPIRGWHKKIERGKNSYSHKFDIIWLNRVWLRKPNLIFNDFLDFNKAQLSCFPKITIILTFSQVLIETKLIPKFLKWGKLPLYIKSFVDPLIFFFSFVYKMFKVNWKIQYNLWFATK